MGAGWVITAVRGQRTAQGGVECPDPQAPHDLKWERARSQHREASDRILITSHLDIPFQHALLHAAILPAQ